MMENRTAKSVITTIPSNSMIKVKFILFCCAFFFIMHQSFAQFVVEPFVSSEDFILESWYFNTIDKSERLSIFALSEAKYNFDTEQSSVLSLGNIGYNWKKGFGPVVGWRISSASAAALAGIQYGYYRENFLAYLTLNTELKDNPNIEFYALIQYRKQITEKLKGFSQLQISNNLVDNTHTFSFYRLRLGADLGKIQTGVGLEQTMVGEDWEYDIAPGLFLRLELY
jgi:hypothetical protein